MCCGRKNTKQKKLFQPQPGTNQIKVVRKVMVDSVVFEPGRVYYVDAGVAEKLKGSIE